MATIPVMLPESRDPLWRMPVERYHAMLRSGILTDDDRVELLEGILVEKMAKNPANVYALATLVRLVQPLVPAGWHLRSQDPITLRDSEPEPDLAIVRGEPEDWLQSHPPAAAVAFVAEVSDATLSRDRGLKRRIYARARIPVYWLVDLKARSVDIYSAPKDDEYSRYQAGVTEAPVIIGRRSRGVVETKALFPPA